MVQTSAHPCCKPQHDETHPTVHHKCPHPSPPAFRQMSSGTEYILFPLLLVGRTIPTHTAKEEARFFKKMPASTLRDGFQFFVDKGRKENRSGIRLLAVLKPGFNRYIHPLWPAICIDSKRTGRLGACCCGVNRYQNGSSSTVESPHGFQTIAGDLIHWTQCSIIKG